MCLKLLPKWVTPPTRPAFDDAEGGTAIEMVGRIYAKMNELIESYNKFAKDVNAGNTEFKEGAGKAFEEFAVGLRQEFQDFIDTVNLEIKHFKITAVDEVAKNSIVVLETAVEEAKAYIHEYVNSTLDNASGEVALRVITPTTAHDTLNIFPATTRYYLTLEGILSTSCDIEAFDVGWIGFVYINVREPQTTTYPVQALSLTSLNGRALVDITENTGHHVIMLVVTENALHTNTIDWVMLTNNVPE